MFASEPGTADNDELINFLGIQPLNENYSQFYLKTLAELRVDISKRPDTYIKIASKVSENLLHNSIAVN